MSTHTHTREEDDDWDQDIQAETKDECAKFGPVEHIAVDKDSQGFVYIKFATVTAATAAQKALNNRFFGGRTVSTEFQFEKVRLHHLHAIRSTTWKCTFQFLSSSSNICRRSTFLLTQKMCALMLCHEHHVLPAFLIAYVCSRLQVYTQHFMK